MKSRTKARSIALQVLYEVDVSGHHPEIALEYRLGDNENNKKLNEFTRRIVMGVYPLFSLLDEFISQHAPEWPLDQIATIDRNILRIALWEFAVEGCAPVKVAINEAIELSKLYGSDSTPRFVNGVLGSLAIRQNEITRSFKENKSQESSQ